LGGISMEPTEVTGLPAEDPVTAMSSGEKHSCALLQSGGVMCWGGNSRGQLGDGTTQDRPSPVEAAGLPLPAAEVSCGGEYTCARLENATVHCWGANDEGQLGSGTNDDSLVPVEVVCEAPGI
jgi:alpha-tubulin suppressor-like RCC1 family protein